jgi:hypothetical protein
MAVPLMATCLLARAATSLLCRKPVYRALAERLIESYEQELARRETPAPSSDLTESEPALVEDPATPTPPEPREPT